MGRFIARHILTGLMTILPVLLTAYLLYWFAVTAENLLGGLLHLVLPPTIYWPGMGLVAGLAVAFVIGLLMHAYIVQRLFAMGEQLLYHTPIIKSVYRALRDFLDYLSPKRNKEFEQVVSVKLGDTGMKVIGLITQHDHNKMPHGFADEDSVLVYIPLSYMIGGYAVLVPRSTLEPLDMSMEEAMRFALTAGVTSNNNKGRKGGKTTSPQD